MCEGHSGVHQANPTPNVGKIGRRTLLKNGLLAAVGLSALGGMQLWRPPEAAAAGAPSGLLPVLNAMHIHGSFSELQGSLDSQLSEAKRCGVHVMWPSDHDWRMGALKYLTTLRFLEQETSNGSRVKYVRKTLGSLAVSTTALVTSPASPDDATGGAAHVVAQSSGSAPAWAGFNVQPTDLLRTSIHGTTITLDLNAVSVGADAWAEVLLTHSYHPAQAGRAAGQYQVAYRFGTTAGYETQGLLGVVWLPVRPGWNTRIVLNPEADIARLWPDMATFAGDNSLFDLWFWAGSRNRAKSDAYFANARINRTQVNGDDPLQAQAELMEVLSQRWGVAWARALEVSLNGKHSNWFGGDLHMPNYGVLGTGNVTAATTELIHGYGGLASYNHPLGVKQVGLSSQSTQDSARRKLAATLIKNRCYGTDIIEVGYHQRGGASLETLMALADSLARNGIWLTYNGVSDNHTGTYLSWTNDKAHNTFATSTWATSTSEADLLAALRAGRTSCRELGVLPGSIWFDVDGSPMGSVTVSAASARTLKMTVTGLPTAGHVEVVQGPVDYAGAGTPDPGTRVVRTVDVAALAAGEVRVTLDTSSSCFVRLNLYDAVQGRRTAFTGPTWLLRSAPPTLIPAARAA